MLQALLAEAREEERKQKKKSLKEAVVPYREIKSTIIHSFQDDLILFAPAILNQQLTALPANDPGSYFNRC